MVTDGNTNKVKEWMAVFEKDGTLDLSQKKHEMTISHSDFLESVSIHTETTLEVIRR